MWESSRMMLPEHVEAILEWQKGLEKVKKPIIDEQQWTEFAHIIQEAKACKRRIKITIWKDGIFDEIVGWVHNVDPQLKRIRLNIDEIDVDYVKFSDITGIEPMD